MFGKKKLDPVAAAESPENIARAVAEIKRLEAELAAAQTARDEVEWRVRQLANPYARRYDPSGATMEEVFTRLAEITAAWRKEEGRTMTQLRESLQNAESSVTFYRECHEEYSLLRRRLNDLLRSGYAGDRDLIRYSAAEISAILDEVAAAAKLKVAQKDAPT